MCCVEPVSVHFSLHALVPFHRCLFLFEVLYLTNHSFLLCRNFDASLRQRDPRWGIRDLELVQKLAEQNGLGLVKTKEMPANNLVVQFRKL